MACSSCNVSEQHTIHIHIGMRPDLLSLEHLTIRTGKSINIIEETAHAYRKIGTILLNDRRGVRVDSLEMDENWKTKEIMRRIYKQWIAEDEHYSWTTLTECLRACSLNTLASTIEEHFGIPSPVQMEEGTHAYIHVHTCTYSRRQKNASFPSRSVLLSVPSHSVPFFFPFFPFFSRSVRFRLFNSGCSRLEARLGRVLTAPRAYTSIRRISA